MIYSFDNHHLYISLISFYTRREQIRKYQKNKALNNNIYHLGRPDNRVIQVLKKSQFQSFNMKSFVLAVNLQVLGRDHHSAVFYFATDDSMAPIRSSNGSSTATIRSATGSSRSSRARGSWKPPSEITRFIYLEIKAPNYHTVKLNFPRHMFFFKTTT